jgi:D-3-phosphoglycerate dehydrogenase / 2-oxoglutarate reductase
MLSKVNELFSESGLNIEGQYLQTRGDVGYVVIDVSGAAADATQLKDRLAAIPGTLRARVLY